MVGEGEARGHGMAYASAQYFWAYSSFFYDIYRHLKYAVRNTCVSQTLLYDGYVLLRALGNVQITNAKKE